jgi:ABC-2 type transport system permease protein
MNKLRLIIAREFLAKVRNKSFIIMTFVSPLLVVGIALLVGFLSTLPPKAKTYGLYDANGIMNDFSTENASYTFVNVSSVSKDLLQDKMLENAFDGILMIENNANDIGVQFISDDSPSMSLIADWERFISKKLTENNWENAAIDLAQMERLRKDVTIKLQKTSGQATVKGLNEIKIVIGGAFGYLIMMFIVIYGNFVMRSVIEEKTNRIIEIIVSSVKPFVLMMGKIIGTSLAGLLQFFIWAVLGFGLFFAISVFFDVPIGATSAVDIPEAAQAEAMSGFSAYIQELWTLPIGLLLSCFVIYFVGGYFLYSSFYAAIGAAVDNETDSQQFLLPIIMPLILAIYIGFFTVLNDPHGTIATVFSMVPLTSPIVMLMRIPFGVPLWQIGLSIVILFTTFVGVVWLASKIYRVGILMYGKKPTWSELLKWLKYSS